MNTELINWIDAHLDLPNDDRTVLVVEEYNGKRDVVFGEYNRYEWEAPHWADPGTGLHLSKIIYWAENPKGPRE